MTKNMRKDHSIRPDAIIVQPSLPSRRAAELALQHRVPAVSVPRWFVDQGGLMSYSAIYADVFRKAAVYVDKILKGAQPADLPIFYVSPRARPCRSHRGQGGD
jgi:ABC-type uncharacterized transport system substrate-binding protein